jgi:hypothetical protein
MGDESRTSILAAVKTPITLAALIVLVIEGILMVLTSQLPQDRKIHAFFAMVTVMLVIAIPIGLVLARTRQHAARASAREGDRDGSAPVPGRPDAVQQAYSQDRLFERIENSSSVLMLVMRSETMFREKIAWLAERIRAGRLTLEITLPDPHNSVLMNQLCTIYKDDADELARSIEKVINGILGDTHQSLPKERHGALCVRVHKSYPLYSAYLFDDEELWYIPYHHRPHGALPLPVFVYKRELSRLAVYKDLRSLECTPIQFPSPPKRTAQIASP